MPSRRPRRASACRSRRHEPAQRDWPARGCVRRRPTAPSGSRKTVSPVRSAPPNPETTQAFAELLRHFPLATPWFHERWYAAMDDESLKRIFIMGPRLHAKTSCVLTYALRRLCEDHQLRIGIISQTDAMAKHFLAEIKYELQANEALIEQYATQDGGRPFQGDRWTTHQITLSDAREGPRGICGKDVSVFSVGRGGQITGYHCDLADRGRLRDEGGDRQRPRAAGHAGVVVERGRARARAGRQADRHRHAQALRRHLLVLAATRLRLARRRRGQVRVHARWHADLAGDVVAGGAGEARPDGPAGPAGLAAGVS